MYIYFVSVKKKVICSIVVIFCGYKCKGIFVCNLWVVVMVLIELENLFNY